MKNKKRKIKNIKGCNRHRDKRGYNVKKMWLYDSNNGETK